MAVFKCKMCGGAMQITDQVYGQCPYCGTTQTFPKLDDERRNQIYDRANQFRRNNEFDKASGLYEAIINEQPTDPEAYWSLVLCRYGITYVEDPHTHKRMPTLNRVQYKSILLDEDYKKALENADGMQRQIYESEATLIDKIQKNILEISSKEEPFDIFICYKETDDAGLRTNDSVYAEEIYNALTKEGYKVFFARITLEDKLGTAYEPYIFAALNSSKVMLVVGTSKDNLNAIWVKNEWSRFMGMINNGDEKVLIPVYKDMDAYDLPDEFAFLQSQDISKIGFMQDLLRGISKITGKSQEKTTTVKETVVVSGNGANPTVDSYLKRAFMFLEDKDWKSANEYCEKVLDIDPENAQAYLGKLLVELGASKKEQLKDLPTPFDNSANYQKIFRFADDELKSEIVGYISYIVERNKQASLDGIYNKAINKMNSAKDEATYQNVINLFQTIPNHKDSQQQIIICQNEIEKIKEQKEQKRIENEKKAAEARAEAERRAEEKRKTREAKTKKIKKIIAIVAPIVCAIVIFFVVLVMVIIPKQKLNKAMNLLKSGDYNSAYALLEKLDKYDVVNDSKYNRAMTFIEKGNYEEAYTLLNGLNYKDSQEQLGKVFSKRKENSNYKDGIISAREFNLIALNGDGTVSVAGKYNGVYANEWYYWKDETPNWNNIIQVSSGTDFILGLKSDGTVVAAGDNSRGARNVSEWNNIIEISAGYYHSVGLKADGTVVDTQYDVSDWRDIVAVSAGYRITAGVKSDGTVVIAYGIDQFEQDDEWESIDVSSWTDIIDVSVGLNCIMGLKSDGTVVYCPAYPEDDEYSEIKEWEGIVSISCDCHAVGLKVDGTVVATGGIDGIGADECKVDKWNDIICVDAGHRITVGVKSDGTVVMCGDNDDSVKTLKSVNLD